MSRFWLMAGAGVGLVGALKTGLVVMFAFQGDAPSLIVLSGLFALFTSLTAGVATVAFYRFRTYFEAQRKGRLTPGADESVSKETVISRYRAEWGLSAAETDVALFVAKGFSNAEIAEMRGCAIATIKSQLGSIYQKSGLETRYQMMAFVTDEVCAMAQGSDPEIVLDGRANTVLPCQSRATPSGRVANHGTAMQPVMRTLTARAG